jgi:hypothetical protein
MALTAILEGKRWLIAALAALLLTAAAAPAHVVFAEAAGPASCLGHEASAVSPPGSSDEIPNGMPGLRNFVEEAFPGVPPGAIYSSIARLRLGSHEACDEALD